jgi:hypothetical protein
MANNMNKAETLAYRLKQSNIPAILVMENRKIAKRDLIIRVQGDRDRLINILANSMAMVPGFKDLIEASLKAYENGPIERNNG